MLLDKTFTKLSIITATHHRAELLSENALASLQRQRDFEFEWIVVNDGCDRATRTLIEASELPFKTRYLEMPHPKDGFGLCHARNYGLSVATSDFVTYLDDDNVLAPDFVSATYKFFQANAQVSCSMAHQWRRRDRVEDGLVLRSGIPFAAPSATATVKDLLVQKELFDSNGFTHRRQNAPQWNPAYRVFADYEYFLRCIRCWGRSAFRLNPILLVKYVQRSDGVIGQSSYQEWVMELQQILDDEFTDSCLSDSERLQLQRRVEQWQARSKRQNGIAAFSN